MTDEKLYELILETIAEARHLRRDLRPQSESGCPDVAAIRANLILIEDAVDERLRTQRFEYLRSASA